jgi:hypothetical protein
MYGNYLLKNYFNTFSLSLSLLIRVAAVRVFLPFSNFNFSPKILGVGSADVWLVPSESALGYRPVSYIGKSTH